MLFRLNWRTAIFFLFVVAFLVSAPTVVLYTAGYRYQIGANKIVKTGALNITSIPRGALIFIDDKQQKKQTPAVIDRVMPESHIVRVQKDDYSSWEKTLEVKSGQNTFATNIVLFLQQDSESYPEALKTKPETKTGLIEKYKNLKIKNLSDRTVLSSVDENGIASIITYLSLGTYSFEQAPGKYILLFDKSRERIVLIEPTQTQSSILINAPANQWNWSKNEDTLLFSDGFDVVIYSPTTHKQETITRVSEPISGLKWYPKGYVAVYSSLNEINAVELDHRSQRNQTILMKGSVADQFWFENDGEWLAWTGGERGHRKRLQR